MYTVGVLARRHGLSRSALLYYDRIGLLSPSGHSKGEYRRYSDADDQRLARICEYRRAGMALEDISRILDDPAEVGVAEALERRLVELNGEMDALREQQVLVVRLLGRKDVFACHDGMNMGTWGALLSDAGFSANDMRRWHIGFERSAPESHERFLRSLHMPEKEISVIRAMAAAPHEIFNINRDSGRFMKMFFKIYEGLDREGPGNYKAAKRAFDLCGNLPDRASILELGCGSGGATMNLAQLANGTVIATDVYQPYLDQLVKRAKEAGVGDRVTVGKKDMAALDFEPESFDLLWCEGAAYIMGVDKALGYWKQFLKPGGYLVFSDAVWLARDVPDEVREFWAEGYPEMRFPEDTVAAAEAAGYRVLDHFTLDTVSWDDFYRDLEHRLDDVEEALGDDPDARAIIDISRRENELYHAYPGTYGYEFYVLEK